MRSKKNDYITEIDLSFNDAATNAAKALATLPNLKKLNLHANKLRDAGALALSQSKSLEWLNVGQNVISSTGMKYLADNSRCTVIYKDFNQYTSPESLARVGAACAYNQLVLDQKLLSPSHASVVKESAEERAKYIEEHWKKHYKDPKNTLPNLGSVLNVVHVWDPNVREEIFPVEPKL